MAFVLGISVDFVAVAEPNLQRQLESLPRLRDVLTQSEQPEELIEVSGTIGCVKADNYDRVEELIGHLAAFCDKHNTGVPDLEQVCCFVSVSLKRDETEDNTSVARAQALLGPMMAENRLTRENRPVCVIITERTYHALETRFQDLYHSSTEIQGMKVHKRFREGAQDCFVISPIGDGGSPERKRADEVFEMYVKPACERTSYRAMRGDMMRGPVVTPEVEEALLSSPMVIAYLGSPKKGWNPNVMYELGQRKASGLPFVLLKDETDGTDDRELPFDIKDERYVDLPVTTPTDLDDLAAKIRTVRNRIDSGVPESSATSVYPGAIVEIPVRGSKGCPKFFAAAPVLEELFELPKIREKSLEEVITQLVTKMPPYQRKPFLDEQQQIINNLIAGVFADVTFSSDSVMEASATVPIVFEEHQHLKGRAFLPVISSHNLVEATNKLRLRVIYIEVTSATKWSEEDKCFKCSLVDTDGLDLPINPDSDTLLRDTPVES